jgi:hypothetical protein
MTRGARNPVRMQILCTLAISTVIAVGLTASARGAQEHRTDPKAVPQPVPFSHKQHCSENIPCAPCHQTATTGETAGLPAVGVCMACHQLVAANSAAIRKVAAYAKQHKPIPWVRIYRIQDFVFFSHKRHADAEVACAVCHGQVCKQGVPVRQVKLSMMFCVGCHKARKATIKCNACHTLSM